MNQPPKGIQMSEVSQQGQPIFINQHQQNEAFHFDRKILQKPSQLLSMRKFKVHKDINSRQVVTTTLSSQILFSQFEGGNANNIFHQVAYSHHQQLFIYNLCKTKRNFKREQIRKQQIEYLNKFYQTFSKVGTVFTNSHINKQAKVEQCYQFPSIIFRLDQDVQPCLNGPVDQRFISKQLIAKAFVYYEYGYGSFTLWMKQKQHKHAIQFQSYRNLVAVIMTQCYRRLQNFIIQSCSMNIRRLNRAQIKLILVILLNCRQRIKQHYQTYLQYVKLCFFLEDVTITAQKSIQLYHAIVEALKVRIYQKSGESMNSEQRHPGTQSLFNSKGGFTHNEKFQLHRIWNKEYEKEFLELYQNQSDLECVARAFRRKYPDKKMFFNEFSLKLRLNKILRERLKKIQMLIKLQKTWNLPQLHSLSKKSYKAILQNGNLYGIRIMLLKINQKQHCQRQQIEQAIITLNQFIIASRPFENKLQTEKYTPKDKEKQIKQSQQFSNEVDFDEEQQPFTSLSKINDGIE